MRDALPLLDDLALGELQLSADPVVAVLLLLNSSVPLLVHFRRGVRVVDDPLLEALHEVRLLRQLPVLLLDHRLARLRDLVQLQLHPHELLLGVVHLGRLGQRRCLRRDLVKLLLEAHDGPFLGLVLLHEDFLLRVLLLAAVALVLLHGLDHIRELDDLPLLLLHELGPRFQPALELLLHVLQLMVHPGQRGLEAGAHPVDVVLVHLLLDLEVLDELVVAGRLHPELLLVRRVVDLVELVLQAADVVLKLFDLLGVAFVHVVDLVPLLLDPDLLLELLLVALLGLILELVAPGLLLVLILIAHELHGVEQDLDLLLAGLDLRLRSLLDRRHLS
mmetsp:Transcript_71475/g.209895  ORF Transcript_71475/g.209895 Transcript_71475/m.209895 type:complete len:333 (-) Transcript_71475:634-1632(-)